MSWSTEYDVNKLSDVGPIAKSRAKELAGQRQQEQCEYAADMATHVAARLGGDTFFVRLSGHAGEAPEGDALTIHVSRVTRP